MTPYLRNFLSALTPRRWYDVYPNQGTGGKPLPESLRRPPGPMSAIGPLVDRGKLKRRSVERKGLTASDNRVGLPQIMRIV